MTSLLEILKQKIYALREGLQLTESVDDLIKKLPTAELERDYYYDFVKDALVPKSTLGVQISEQTNQLISLLNQVNINRFVGYSYEVELADGQVYEGNLEGFDYSVNTIYLEADFVNYTSYSKFLIYFYMWTPAKSSTPVEIYENWIMTNYSKRIVQINHFIPCKDFQVGFVNHSGRTIKLRYTFSYSENKDDDSYVYDLQLSNDFHGWSILSGIRTFNKVSVALTDAGNINARVRIYINFGFGLYQTIEIHDETINISATDWFYEYEIPACTSITVYIYNNKVSNLDAHVLLFFSNYKEPDLSIDDLNDVSISSPADNEVLAYDSATSEFINQTASEAGLATASHLHTGVYEPVNSYNCRMEVGAYTGDGSINKFIATNFSKQVQFVLIARYYTADNDAEVLWIKAYNWSTFAMGFEGNAGYWRDNRINSFYTTGFYVDDDASNFNPNVSGATYRFIAFGY